MLASLEPFSATNQNSGGEEFECNGDARALKFGLIQVFTFFGKCPKV